jgi:predicted nucleic acid-binding protein
MAFDTNVLVYGLDEAAGHRHRRAKQLVAHCLETQTMFLPAQVLAEFASVALRKLALDPADVEARIGDLRLVAIIEPYTDLDVGAAIGLVDRARLSFWDALAVTVCDRVGVPVLASEDMQDGLRVGRTTVLDPFSDANLGRLGL